MYQNEENKPSNNNITVFYKNQMHNNYKQDEKILKEIINRNIKCKNNGDKLKIIIYY